MGKILVSAVILVFIAALMGCSQSSSPTYTLVPITKQVSLVGVTLGMTTSEAKAVLALNNKLTLTYDSPTNLIYNTSDGGWIEIYGRASGAVYQIVSGATYCCTVEGVTYGDSLDKVKGTLGEPTSTYNDGYSISLYYPDRNIYVNYYLSYQKVLVIGVYDNSIS